MFAGPKGRTYHHINVENAQTPPTARPPAGLSARLRKPSFCHLNTETQRPRQRRRKTSSFELYGCNSRRHDSVVSLTC